MSWVSRVLTFAEEFLLPMVTGLAVVLGVLYVVFVANTPEGLWERFGWYVQAAATVVLFGGLGVVALLGVYGIGRLLTSPFRSYRERRREELRRITYLLEHE